MVDYNGSSYVSCTRFTYFLERNNDLLETSVDN